jgi:hypothetical protein
MKPFIHLLQSNHICKIVKYINQSDTSSRFWYPNIVTVCVFVCQMFSCILYKKQAHFSQLFCLHLRSVTPWQSHDRKSRCLRGRRHSSILYLTELMNYTTWSKSSRILLQHVSVILFRCSMICRWPEPWNFKTSHFRILYSFPSRISALFLLHTKTSIVTTRPFSKLFKI